MMICVWPTNCMSAEWVKRIVSGLTASLSISATPSLRCRSSTARIAGFVEQRHRLVDRVDEVVAQIGDDAAERIGDARPRRHQHACGRPSSRASAVACSGPAPPKANSAKSRGSWPRDTDTMRIAPAIFMLPSRSTAPAAAIAVEAGGLADPFLENRPHMLDGDRLIDRQQLLRIEPAEQQIGVGDGRLGAAAAVADRAGIGAGAFRADLDQARGIDARDRAAAGADRMHRHHRHVDRHRIFDLDLVGDGGLGVEDQRDVGRGAAHVVGDERREAGAPAGIGGGDHAGGRARTSRSWPLPA